MRHQRDQAVHRRDREPRRSVHLASPTRIK
jgi:hypothetical protein